MSGVWRAAEVTAVAGGVVTVRVWGEQAGLDLPLTSFQVSVGDFVWVSEVSPGQVAITAKQAVLR